ncbi:hypothetical protein F5Y05DRAFT_45715 [Hypoxylon sp. FL0543]|nr:hypothetical protein F5Y05DRAFT_45715 [Hypoxylon sp. FL0543]
MPQGAEGGYHSEAVATSQRTGVLWQSRRLISRPTVTSTLHAWGPPPKGPRKGPQNRSCVVSSYIVRRKVTRHTNARSACDGKVCYVTMVWTKRVEYLGLAWGCLGDDFFVRGTFCWLLDEIVSGFRWGYSKASPMNGRIRSYRAGSPLVRVTQARVLQPEPKTNTRALYSHWFRAPLSFILHPCIPGNPAPNLTANGRAYPWTPGKSRLSDSIKSRPWLRSAPSSPNSLLHDLHGRIEPVGRPNRFSEVMCSGLNKAVETYHQAIRAYDHLFRQDFNCEAMILHRSSARTAPLLRG